MAAFQQLLPHFDEYNRIVTNARNDKHLSLTALSEASGVSLSAVVNQSRDSADNPKLFEQAAIAYVLGLSLDKLCGLPAAADISVLEDRIRELELESASKSGEIKRLEEAKAEQLGRDRPLMLALSGFCVMLVLVVIGYMIFDAHILSAGLFKSAGLSIFAVLLALLLLSALTAVVYALRRLFKK